MLCVLSTFWVSLFSKIHLLIQIISLFTIFIHYCIELLDENVHLSSDYVIKLSLEELTMSLIYIRNRTGTRIDPWRTPWLLKF